MKIQRSETHLLQGFKTGFTKKVFLQPCLELPEEWKRRSIKVVWASEAEVVHCIPSATDVFCLAHTIFAYTMFNEHLNELPTFKSQCIWHNNHGVLFILKKWSIWQCWTCMSAGHKPSEAESKYCLWVGRVCFSFKIFPQLPLIYIIMMSSVICCC